MVYLLISRPSGIRPCRARSSSALGRLNVDFLVIGAGHAGLAFAIEASSRGARVALIERPRARAKVGEIVEASVEAPLRRLGVWHAFLEQDHLRSSGTRSLWSEQEPAERSAIVNPFGGGWFVDRGKFDLLLTERAATVGARIFAVQDPPRLIDGQYMISIGDDVLTAPYALEASGRHGAVVAPTERLAEDDLVGVVGYIDQPMADHLFRLEATAMGWWYAAPLPGGSGVLALMTYISILPRGTADKASFWQQSLKTLAKTGIECRLMPPRLYIHPASSVIRGRLYGDRWLAIGDAASAYDPLLGIGVVGALVKGMAAAGVLSSGSDMDLAARRYAELETTTFIRHKETRRRLYAQAAAERNGAFWEAVRRRGHAA